MTDNRKFQTMIRELVANLGIDAVRSLAKAANPMNQQQLSRVVDAVMHRHEPPHKEEQHE